MEQAAAQQALGQLTAALNLFRCSKHADIETFLHEKAIDFEKRGYCTVYLILDESVFNNEYI